MQHSFFPGGFFNTALIASIKISSSPSCCSIAEHSTYLNAFIFSFIFLHSFNVTTSTFSLFLMSAFVPERKKVVEFIFFHSFLIELIYVTNFFSLLTNENYWHMWTVKFYLWIPFASDIFK